MMQKGNVFLEQDHHRRPCEQCMNPQLTWSTLCQPTSAQGRIGCEESSVLNSQFSAN